MRVTSIRNPWSYGDDVFHIVYRYLCLHLLFCWLHGFSQNRFYTAECSPTFRPLGRNQSFGEVFDARLFSAQERSTSELLRTL